MDDINIMRLVIPYAGKMLNCNVGKNNKALCFCINKGYIESDEVEPLYYLRESFKSEYDWLYNVGNIDKIHIGGRKFVYRQRIFFQDFAGICDLCKENGIIIKLSDSFKIGINNVVNCGNELKYLEWYAKVFNEDIETYLTNSCKVQIYNILNERLMITPIKRDVDNILKNRTGYLERAPFLVESYSKKDNTSKVYIYNGSEDTRIYTTSNLTDIESYGFSTKVVAKDRKAGVFRHES